jgi:hypothetical protein
MKIAPLLPYELAYIPDRTLLIGHKVSHCCWFAETIVYHSLTFSNGLVFQTQENRCFFGELALYFTQKLEI